MSMPVVLVLGFFLGAIGGALHLAVLRWRAAVAVRSGAFASLAGMPLGLVAPAAAVLAAARVAPEAAWITPVGMLAVRLLVLGRVKR